MPSVRARRLLAGAATAVLPVMVAALVLLPDRVGLDRWLPFAVFAALRPALTGAAVALLVVGVPLAVLLRRRRSARHRRPLAAMLVALVGTAAVVVTSAAIVVPRAVPDPPAPPGGTPLTIVELNAFEGHADVDALAAVVRGSDADLVVVPEAGDRFRRALAERLPGYRSWTNVAPGVPDVRGITLLAAPRMGDVTARAVTDVPGTPDDTRYPWAELTGGLLGPVRLGAVHLVSVVPRWISYWPGELAALQRWCAAPDPVLVVGDLNSTPDHSGFRAGTAGCADAGTTTGQSLVGTWRSTWPRPLGAQIDHVLSARGPQARDVQVVDVPGSDHRGLVVRLRLP